MNCWLLLRRHKWFPRARLEQDQFGYWWWIDKCDNCPAIRFRQRARFEGGQLQDG